MDKFSEILNSPEAMDKIMGIARNLMDTEQETQPESNPLSSIDPKVLQTVAGIISEYNSTDDRRFGLLGALRPYVNGKDSAHIDKAMQIMRLSRVISHTLKQARGGDGLV